MQIVVDIGPSGPFYQPISHTNHTLWLEWMWGIASCQKYIKAISSKVSICGKYKMLGIPPSAVCSAVKVPVVKCYKNNLSLLKSNKYFL